MSESYSQYVEAPSVSGFDQLDNLIDRQRRAEQDVERLEKELRDAKATLKDVSEHQIPNLMDEMGLEKFKTKKGFTIQVKKKLRLSIAGDKKQPAIKWLEEHGYGDVVKRLVSVPFGVNEGEKVDMLIDELSPRYPGINLDSKVEPQTLTALITKLMKDGVDVPLEVFGGYEQRTTKITV